MPIATLPLALLLGLLPETPPPQAPAMGIPSVKGVRGQQDTVGFAATAAQMARVWELSEAPPAPDPLGSAADSGVAGALCPHDDYLYAARIYRRVLPLVTARTVILLGTFHGYRRAGVRGLLVFDPYRAWRAPDGEVPVSSLRTELIAAMDPGDRIQDAALHDREHSLEPIAHWLRHANPEVEIVPILVPAMPFPRMEELAARLATALAHAMTARGCALGPDLAIVMSSDAVHYGADFQHIPFGEGGIEPYRLACAQDLALLKGPLAGPISAAKARSFFETCVDPAHPDTYRLTWCGRFAVPFGLLLLKETAGRLGQGVPEGLPLAYGTSIGAPALPLKPLGLGATAPANLYHFVGHPAAAYRSPLPPKASR